MDFNILTLPVSVVPRANTIITSLHAPLMRSFFVSAPARVCILTIRVSKLFDGYAATNDDVRRLLATKANVEDFMLSIINYLLYCSREW